MSHSIVHPIVSSCVSRSENTCVLREYTVKYLGQKWYNGSSFQITKRKMHVFMAALMSWIDLKYLCQFLWNKILWYQIWDWAASDSVPKPNDHDMTMSVICFDSGHGGNSTGRHSRKRPSRTATGRGKHGEISKFEVRGGILRGISGTVSFTVLQLKNGNIPYILGSYLICVCVGGRLSRWEKLLVNLEKRNMKFPCGFLVTFLLKLNPNLKFRNQQLGL